MFTKISLQLADGSKKDVPFEANGATAIRYKEVFRKELMASITGIVDAIGTENLALLMAVSGKELSMDEMDPQLLKIILTIAGSGHLSSASELAYIMNASAEKKDMRSLSLDGYLDWLEQFESMEFLTHTMDFIGLYLGNRQSTSVQKKEDAQLTGK